MSFYVFAMLFARNIYAFQFDLESVERLVQLMPSAFQQAKTELLAFAEFLEEVGRDI